MGIVGKVFNCRIQLIEFFVIRGHWTSLEVNKGQTEMQVKKGKKVNNMGIVGKVFILHACSDDFTLLTCHPSIWNTL